jgi:hypothetical protein
MSDDLVTLLRIPMGANYLKLMDKAAARIEALEAALRFMLVDPPSILNEPDTDAEVIIHYREVARAALDAGIGYGKSVIEP